MNCLLLILSILQHTRTTNTKTITCTTFRNNQKIEYHNEQCKSHCKIYAPHIHFKIPNYITFKPRKIQHFGINPNIMADKEQSTYDKNLSLAAGSNHGEKSYEYDKKSGDGRSTEESDVLKNGRCMDGEDGCKKAKKKNRRKNVHVLFLCFYSTLFIISLIIWFYIMHRRFIINLYNKVIYNIKRLYKNVKTRFTKKKIEDRKVEENIEKSSESDESDESDEGENDWINFI